MTDPTEIARVAAGLTDLERELLTGQSPGWGSWMFSVAADLAGKGLMKQRDGSYFTTPAGEAVRDHILREKSGG